MESAESLSVKERLILVINSLNLTRQKFEIECNLSNGYIANIRKSIGSDALERISNRYPNINKAWVLLGEGKMFNDGNQIDQKGKKLMPFYDDITTMGATKESINDRVIYAVNSLLAAQPNLTKSAIADSLSISNSKFSEILNRRMNAGPEILSYLTNLYGISASWLLTGSGEMMEVSSHPVGKEPYIDGQKVIPLIPLEAFAGYPEEQFNDLVIEEYYQISEFKTADFLMRVKGDSMTPKYNGGDLVACMKIKSLSFFQWHRIYAIYTKSQGVLIKRVEPAEDEACIQLFSDNPIYKPFIIRKEEIADIALVLGAVTLE